MVLVWNKRKTRITKPVIDNHLKFVFMALITFVVLNAHNFVLSLLK